MATEALFAELETHTHSERVRRMIALGRQSLTDGATAATLRELASGGFYERFLALAACRGSRDGAQVLRALTEESRRLRSLAVKLTPAVCTDEQIVAALETVRHDHRLLLLRGLLRRRRRAPIDTFLDRRAAEGDERLGELLSFGSEEAVRHHLEAAAPRFGLVDWRRLARRHPDITLEALEQRARVLQEPDARLLSQVDAVLSELAESRPDGALALVQEMLRHEPPSRFSLQRLAQRRPQEVADLLLASGGEVNASLRLPAEKLPEDRLLTLLNARPALLPTPRDLLKRTAPERRRAIYAVAGRGWRDAEGVLDPAVVALLPGELRELEARRHLALPALATRPTQRLPYAAFLPWDDARAALDPFVRNPDADLRGAALAALIGVARYYRERLPDALALALARKNEQDPVRNAMMTALAALPPSRWRSEHLEGLGQVLRDALDAADLSTTTAGMAEKIVVALVPFHPEWAAQWLNTLVRERGQLQLRRLGDRLSDADVERIAPALLPVFASWETREREYYLLQAASSLGRRLRIFEGLADILEGVLISTKRSYTASQILTLFRTHRPQRLTTLVPALLQSDDSFVTLPVVYEYLHRRRQDLIIRYLGRQAYAGRFSTGKTRFVLPFLDGFFRWTAAQQATFAETLGEVIADSERDTPAIHQAIQQLAQLPAVFPAVLITLADADNKKLAVRDAALRALARLDAGQGVPSLLTALEDDRARIAIYALRSAILEMPAERTLALLQGVPTRKVTVAKEVIRLLGELDTPGAFPALLALGEQTLHRDARVAWLRALWDHLERDETWPLLNAAAVDPDPAIAGGVVRIPTDRLAPEAQRRLLGLIAALLGHPDVKVRLDTLARCVSLPLPDPERILRERLLARLASPLPDEHAAAARACFSTYSTARDADVIGQAIRQIRGDRRALTAALAELQSALVGKRTRLQPVVRAVLAALEEDPLTAQRRVELGIAGLNWEEIPVLLGRLADTGELHAEALMTAVHAVRREGVRPDGAEGLAAVEAELASHTDERLRRLALAALVGQAATTQGWAPDLRARLEVYRNDSAPLVAAAAQFTLPPPEDIPEKLGTGL